MTIDLSQIVSVTPTDESLPIRITIDCKNLSYPLIIKFPIRVKKGEHIDIDAHINKVKRQTKYLILNWMSYINHNS